MRAGKPRRDLLLFAIRTQPEPSKKLGLDWAIVEAALAELRALVDDVRPVALSTHESALSFARRDGFDIYDALILAAALEAGCETLFSEDFQHGRRFGDLTVVNPFL